MIKPVSGSFRYRLWAGLATLFVSVALAGCTGLPLALEPPAVTISDFGVGSAGLFEQQFNLKLRIQNPNSVDLRIDGMAFDLEVNDQPFAKGVGNQAVTVPRYGSGFMPVEAVSSLGGLVAQVAVLARGARAGFRYRIKGTLSIADGGRVPFERSAEFALSPLANAGPAASPQP